MESSKTSSEPEIKKRKSDPEPQLNTATYEKVSSLVKAGPSGSTTGWKQNGRKIRNRNHNHYHNKSEYFLASLKKDPGAPGSTNPTKRKQNQRKIFPYGNYNRYYGYRNNSEDKMDLRLLTTPKGIFENKDILDVGCNVGFVTWSIARDFKARRVVGVDIDPELVQAAKNNMKHYYMSPGTQQGQDGSGRSEARSADNKGSILYPYNVRFRQENYVLESDDLLETVKPEYDVILCLSITKWIHLNNGDDGLKRFFRRTFLHLRPGGKLILEPQPWSSYKNKKKLTDQIFETYKGIRFRPNDFPDFLLKDIGFTSMETLPTPAYSSKGFQRPLIVFSKAELNPRESPIDPQVQTDEIMYDNYKCKLMWYLH